MIPNGTLPTILPQGEKTSAIYKVTNETFTSLNSNFVKFLPLNAKQVTCDANFCGATFNLGPKGASNDHCLLKLSISGPINAADPNPKHHLSICTANGSLCSGTNSPLDVTQVAARPLQGIAVGTYSNQLSQFFPLIATSNSGGEVWGYPTAVFSNLKDKIDPLFLSSLLAGSGCAGPGDKSICIAAGFYCQDAACLAQFPLIALGKKRISQWTYPTSIFTDLKTQIDPNFASGAFNGASCTGSGGSSQCVASGSYCTDPNCINQYPLLALTNNGGSSWSYPKSIFQNLTSAIDPSFFKGALPYASCTGASCNSVCIATGSFCTDSGCDTTLPLLAVSSDNGLNWVYPSYIFKNLTTKIDPNLTDAMFTQASCTGSGDKSICIAPGQYFTNIMSVPLLALTQNGGKDWTYPADIYKNLSTAIAPNFAGGFFNSGSCTGSGDETSCIAVGAYFNSKNDIPIIAVTRDGGKKWNYPRFIFTKLKTVVDPNFTRGVFNAASCTGQGNKGICIASGYYCTDKFCNNMYPLLALSKNGGKDWSYPPDIFQNLPEKLDPNFISGLFSGADCTKSISGNLCVASGQFSAGDKVYPLLVVSTDEGSTWTYPPSIFQNLNVHIDPNLVNASFNSAATTGGAQKNKWCKINKPHYLQLNKTIGN